MVKAAKNNDRDLLEILVAIAWIDGEIQPAEQEFLAKIVTEQNIASDAELQDLLTRYRDSSSEKCYQLLEQYLGANPNPADYDNLLTSVSQLIYSDDDIATEEAALLNKIQNLDPQNSQTRSTFDKAIGKIQKLYQAALNKK